jgi:diguanylate cyclase (GGDEF)-like protein
MKLGDFSRLHRRFRKRAIVVWLFFLGAIAAAIKEFIGKRLQEPLAAAGDAAGNWLTADYRVSLAVEPKNSLQQIPFFTISMTGWVIALIVLALASGAGLLGWLLYRWIQVLQDELNQDQMTGTLNKRGLMAAFDKWEKSRTSPDVPSVMALLDLVAFHKINQQHGQSGGDKVLAAVGHVLRSETKQKEVVGRPGGDEFLLLMEGDEKAVLAALRARQKELNPCAVFEIGTDLMIPFRAGVTRFSGESFDVAYGKASEALKAAKGVPEQSIEVEKVNTYVTLWKPPAVHTASLK